MSDEVREQLSEIDQLMNDAPVIDSAGSVVEVKEVDTEAFLADGLLLGFGLVAAKSGKHWELDQEEAKTLAGAYDPVLKKYFPNIGNAIGPEVTAIAITAMVLLPRIQETARISAEAVKLENKQPISGVTSVDDSETFKAEELEEA